MLLRAALGLLLALCVPALAHAQGTLLQGGPVAPGRSPMYVNSGTSQPVVQDSGPAGGGGAGLGLAEQLLVARGTGTAPYVAQGSGPLGTNWCDYDAPTTNAAGYHALCMSPNAQGGGLISYNAYGGAAQLPLNFNVNGVSYTLAALGLFTPGSVAFGGSTGTLAQNNSKLFFDNTLFGLQIGTSTYGGSLEAGIPGLWIEGGTLTVNTGNVNLPNTDQGGIHIGMPFAKNQAPSGGYGKMKFFTNDLLETYLQGTIGLIPDPVAANRRFGIGCIVQGTGPCSVILNESGGNVGVNTITPQVNLSVAGTTQVASFEVTTGTGASTDNKMQFGVANGVSGFIQAVHPGTGFLALVLQPSGGAVNVTGELAVLGGGVTFSTATKTVVLKQGANGTVGTFTCTSGGAITVSNSNVAITDAITISLNTAGGSISTAPAINAITAATSFVAKCATSDTSVYNYAIIKNAA